MIDRKVSGKTLLQHLRGLKSDRRGTIASTFVLSAFGLFTVGGAAMDYASLSQTRNQLQAAADAAALAGAKEFRLGNANISIVTQVANNYASQALASAGVLNGNASIAPSVDTSAKTVTVAINAIQPAYIMQMLGSEFVKVQVSATAKVTGGAPICVIGLDAKYKQTILMDVNARLEAPNCAIYSNSKAKDGLEARSNSMMTAAFICSAGGKVKGKMDSFTPDPQTDCPVIPDPLALRPQPAVGPCLQTNLKITSGMVTLLPGTYCGGISISNGATVNLSSGVYVMKDGPLHVTGNGTLNGSNVGLFLSGQGAVINFEGASNISLTAPVSGDMAGMLMFEDRASPEKQVHNILSDNARMLLGTIYLPQNRLHVAANRPIADQSAYTIVVVNLFTLSEGPTMVLNTNYGNTNIPVPAGVGPNSNRAALIN